MDIRHVVVLMLENRSFDSMLGMLYPSDGEFDGLTGTETNTWHRPDGTQQVIPVWKSPELSTQNLCIPDPDPGELFTDIQMQIHGLNADGTANKSGPTMGGFVDNYMRQPVTTPAADPSAVMHYFTPDQVPVLSQLARAFGVSDRWFASAPCQTWPNRFFAHCATAGGYVNNSPTHFPYLMDTVFNRLQGAGQTWRIYFQDIPQSSTLSRLWLYPDHFADFHLNFVQDAAQGKLPAYSFIEPRYFASQILNTIPDDQHPPHDVAYGEALIASVYNAVRSGPGWGSTLLIITYDEHGGCYDHVIPPPASPPGGPYPDTFGFDYFGVRVPAVIISPHVAAGSILRPAGLVPFDHSSIIATLRQLFPFKPLTARDAAAPNLLEVLNPSVVNNGLDSVTAAPPPPAPAQVARVAAKPPNDMQRSLSTAALHLPTSGADTDAHNQRLQSVPDTPTQHATVGEAAAAVVPHMRAFLGR